MNSSTPIVTCLFGCFALLAACSAGAPSTATVSSAETTTTPSHEDTGEAVDALQSLTRVGSVWVTASNVGQALCGAGRVSGFGTGPARCDGAPPDAVQDGILQCYRAACYTLPASPSADFWYITYDADCAPGFSLRLPPAPVHEGVPVQGKSCYRDAR